MKGKKFGTEDIVIPCPKCGTFHITNRAKGGDYVQNVRETGKSYDMFSRVNATLDRIRESESQPSRKRAELYTYNAREIRIADPINEILYIPYMAAVRDMCDVVKNGDIGGLDYLCRITLECNDISKYDLMETLRYAYGIITERRDDVEPALFLKIKVEEALVDSAFEGFDIDEEDHLQDHYLETLADYAEEFDGLSPEQKAILPFVFADAWNYSMTVNMRIGREKESKECAKKVISAIRKAVKSGAVIDRGHVKMFLGAYRLRMTVRNSVYKDPIKDVDLIDDPYYSVQARYLYMEGIVSKASDDVMAGFMPGSLDIGMRGEAMTMAQWLIDTVETWDDIKDVITSLCEVYMVRGAIRKDNDDMVTALNYAILYYSLGYMDGDELNVVMSEVLLKQPLGSPVSMRIFRILGYPVDLIR